MSRAAKQCRTLYEDLHDLSPRVRNDSEETVEETIIIEEDQQQNSSSQDPVPNQIITTSLEQEAQATPYETPTTTPSTLPRALRSLGHDLDDAAMVRLRRKLVLAHHHNGGSEFSAFSNFLSLIAAVEDDGMTTCTNKTRGSSSSYYSTPPPSSSLPYSNLDPAHTEGGGMMVLPPAAATDEEDEEQGGAQRMPLGTGQLRIDNILATVLSFVEADFTLLMTVSSVSKQWRFYSRFMPQWRKVRLLLGAQNFRPTTTYTCSKSPCPRHKAVRILLQSRDEALPVPPWLATRREQSIGFFGCCSEPMLTAEIACCLPCHFGSAAFCPTTPPDQSSSSATRSSRAPPPLRRGGAKSLIEFLAAGAGCLFLTLVMPIISNMLMSCKLTANADLCPSCPASFFCPVCYLVYRWRRHVELSATYFGGPPPLQPYFSLCAEVAQRPPEYHMV